MTMRRRLLQRAASGANINVAVYGAGFMGQGVTRQINIAPGMRCALVVNRTPENAKTMLQACGVAADAIVHSDDPRALCDAIRSGKTGIATDADIVREMDSIHALVEVTGAVEYGARVALAGIETGKHVIMLNAETDATVGWLLREKADKAGVIYTNADGDQPGVLMRLIEFVRFAGLEVIAAVNCKGFLDFHATPDTIRPWAEKQNTSLAMTTAFTDGTKMNIENAVLCNAAGLRPDVRGMHGIDTDYEHALDDCVRTFTHRGVVDFTLGGGFGGGVFVIAYGEDPQMIQPYMRYLKMGEGPYYMFFRPYHLCHIESPMSIAEAVLDHQATIAPMLQPVTDVVTMAKRDLEAGAQLDGIGGYDCYGLIDTIDNAHGMLPVGLAEVATLNRPINADEPIPLNAVTLDDQSLLVQMRHDELAQRQAAAA